MLPRFLAPSVVVANHASSGESLRSSLSAGRLDKVLGALQPGDYVFIQYGHNDQKQTGPGIGPFSNYKQDLKRFVSSIRGKKGNPVLITPVHRRTFTPEGKLLDSHGDYAEAVRQLAKEARVPLIDLHRSSQILYEAWEARQPGSSAQAFAPGDATHHNNYGSYQLARCVVEGIRASDLKIKEAILEEPGVFDPARPPGREDFEVPASRLSTRTKPLGE